MKDFYCEQVIPAKVKVDIIFETNQVMAFHHTDPFWEKHVVIIPKAHIDSLANYPNTEELNFDFFEAIKFVTSMFEKNYGGCRISSNIGKYQSTKHLHWYVHYGSRLRAENGDHIKK
ncbi:MAG: HIT family protein [Bacteroidia bacterium]